MRAMFTKRNCPYCREVISAVTRLNSILPFGEKIPIINVESSDSRLRFLKNVFGDAVKTPCLVIDKKYVSADLGRYAVKMTDNVFVFSMLDREHMYELLNVLSAR